ncbi:vitamin K epoxide reductase family protein [Chrysiogenes arsenatis]|uniref:vitamin K epoxide reductase family protein n=1 Tax=Chrysiogenes arsenatis TaxID=309797 RepID=UPI00041E5443|nr:vitamin K epoxide reductase family protein [Chrysiogenes arsenatis]
MARLLVINFSILGFAFCVLNAFGADIACITDGCQIYSNYTIFGFSVYFYGAAGFALIAITGLLFPRGRTAHALFVLLVALMVAGDALFLIYQYFYWFCMSCMVVAALIGLIGLAALSVSAHLRSKWFYSIFSIWAFFFFVATFGLIKEIFLTPIPSYGSKEALVQIYVSPSCPACKTLALNVLQRPELLQQSAFYLVPKSDDDSLLIAGFYQDVATGATEKMALETLFSNPLRVSETAITSEQRFIEQVNTMAMARIGAKSIPVVIAPGLIFEPSTPSVNSISPTPSFLQGILQQAPPTNAVGFSAGCSFQQNSTDSADCNEN